MSFFNRLFKKNGDSPEGKKIKCPQCKTKLDAAATVCTACGFRLEKQDGKAMQCPSCHAELPPGSSFCNKCGNKIGAPAAGNVCKGCGAPLLPGSAFCLKCGTHVQTAPSPAPVPKPSPVPAPAPKPSPAPYDPDATGLLDEPAPYKPVRQDHTGADPDATGLLDEAMLRAPSGGVSMKVTDAEDTPAMLSGDLSEADYSADDATGLMIDDGSEATGILGDADGTESTSLLEQQRFPVLVPCRENGQRDPYGESAEVTKPVFRIGKQRSLVDFCIKVSSVSRIHAEIHQKNNAYFLIDKSSRNGTWLNGKKLVADKPYPLSDGDSIKFAGQIYQFQV